MIHTQIHEGMCGNSRMSLRSFVATCLFMSSAILTAGLTRADFAYDSFYVPDGEAGIKFSNNGYYILPLVIAGIFHLLWKLTVGKGIDTLKTAEYVTNVRHVTMNDAVLSAHSFFCGVVAGIGIVLTGMVNPFKLLKCLDFSGRLGWYAVVCLRVFAAALA